MWEERKIVRKERKIARGEKLTGKWVSNGEREMTEKINILGKKKKKMERKVV